MSARRWALLGLLGVGILAALALAGLKILQSARPRPTPVPTAPAATYTAPAADAAQAGLSARQVAIGFVTGYGTFLDGGAASALRFASITATGQAEGGGRIPVAFRDGRLRLGRLILAAGGYSAQATVVLDDRQERYPFSLQLLRQQHGWQVAGLEPPDLAMDRTVAPVSAPQLPAGAVASTRRFVLAYARLRAGRGGRPAGLSAAAAAAIRSNSDSLAGLRLGSTVPRLVKLVFGPLNGEREFAATATVRFAVGTQQFSVLMTRRPRSGAWLCAAFL